MRRRRSIGCEATTSSSTLINTSMENKITSLWNKIKITRDTFSKIALIKEFDDLVTKYKDELIKKYQREKK
jgi:hypothetical protein